jgi:hypothetical protein
MQFVKKETESCKQYAMSGPPTRTKMMFLIRTMFITKEGKVYAKTVRNLFEYHEWVSSADQREKEQRATIKQGFLKACSLHCPKHF